jgi:S-formylglutathione hydrolase FrmB
MQRQAIFLLLIFSAAGYSPAAEPLKFRVRLDEQSADQPITGRLYVFLSKRSAGEPRFGPSWFNPEPFFGLDVRAMKPGETRTVGGSADACPVALSKIPKGKYRVQALLDHDFYHSNYARGVGNLYSEVQTFDLDPASSGTIDLRLDQVVKPTKFAESKWVKQISSRSEMLSKFHNREVLDTVAVALPASYYDEPKRRYPVIYIVSGFGGTHASMARGYTKPRGAGKDPSKDNVEFIRVMLDGQCKWGHHVYANSATNGPRGDALVREMIPHVDKTFRTVAASTARFVAGHSSGGWSSLWLQVSYPDTFGGVWSTSPDPVDFRDFQQIDLYARPPLLMYRDKQGKPRPLARRGHTPFATFEQFARRDDCVGRGGQLRSFEAAFSPRGKDGLPLRLWDRKTSRIDPKVAEAWRKYDIRLLLEKHWRTLGPKLKGKIHITAGELDTFYLEGAVELLAASLKKLDSDAEITIVPGASHGSYKSAQFHRRQRQQMSTAFLKHHGK